VLTATEASCIVERVNQGKYGPTLNKIGQKIAGAAHMGHTSIRVKLGINDGRFWVREKLRLMGYKISGKLETEIGW